MQSPPARRFEPWFVILPAAFLVLLWSCRGAPLGAAVLDDFRYLYDLRFHRAWDLFDSMGFGWYWRPLGRQLYFGVIGPWLLKLPLLVPVVHAAMLAALALVLYRIVAPRLGRPAAVVAATFPVLGEPTRVLLGWASGAQYLLAMLALAVALHETLGRRWLTAAVAALAALLANEVTLLALPVLAVVSWNVTAQRRGRWAAVAGLAIAIVVWGLGLWVARSRGVLFPSGAEGAPPVAALPAVLAKSLVAQLDLEDLSGSRLWIPLAGYALIAAIVLAGWRRSDARDRLRGRAGVVTGGLAAFVILSGPLVFLEPGWNGWRSALPGVGFGIALAALLGASGTRVLAGFVAVRALALVLATPAPATVEAAPPASASHFSFAAMSRLQRLVSSTREALTDARPTLPRGAVVCYWDMPLRGDWAFQRSTALRVWYGDTTLTWTGMGAAGGLDGRIDAVVAYTNGTASPAAVIAPAAFDAFRRSRDTARAGRLRQTDSLLTVALAAQPVWSEPFAVAVAHNQARVALALGDFQRADSLNGLVRTWQGESAPSLVLQARIALRQDRLEEALRALERALSLDPADPEALELVHELESDPRVSITRE